jgi:hypothetical protein
MHGRWSPAAASGILRPVPRRQQNAKIWVAISLTRSEIKELRARAYDDRRSIGSYVAWSAAQALGGSRARRPRSRETRESRVRYSVGFRLPPEVHKRLVRGRSEGDAVGLELRRGGGDGAARAEGVNAT